MEFILARPPSTMIRRLKLIVVDHIIVLSKTVRKHPSDLTISKAMLKWFTTIIVGELFKILVSDLFPFVVFQLRRHIT